MKVGCRGKYLYLFDPEWEVAGVRHGFIGKSADFRYPTEKSLEEFCSTFECQTLLLPKQTHSREIMDLREENDLRSFLITPHREFPVADAILISRSGPFSLACGIRTADCLPILLRSPSVFGLVHAGWRGLSNRILTRVIQKGKMLGELSVLIGPYACGERYEVGLEVIQAIGDTAVASEHPQPTKKFLDLSRTAVREILFNNPRAKISVLETCTIADTSFHSHRRDKEKRGNNLAFLIIEKTEEKTVNVSPSRCHECFKR
jgi:YfiH family protein